MKNYSQRYLKKNSYWSKQIFVKIQEDARKRINILKENCFRKNVRINSTYFISLYTCFLQFCVIIEHSKNN